MSDKSLTVLGIETSCDETAAAVVRRNADGRGAILSNVVRSQWERHQPFGGVVPEIAARAHVECLDELIAQAMAEAGLGFSDLDAIAVTAGPGLIGGLMVGLATAEAVSIASDKPLIAVNHLEAHALTVGLTDGLDPPYLVLLVSGGHTQLLVTHGPGHHTRLGSTIDDALGEAFDKTAKLFGLGQPGGPEVERVAISGDPHRFALPRPLRGRPEPNFSFAGLKTAVRRLALAIEPRSAQDTADLCASFEQAVVDSVTDRCTVAMGTARSLIGADHPHALVIAGGVAANRRLKAALTHTAARERFAIAVPPIALCGDNAAMIAWTGAVRMAAGLLTPPGSAARPRWPLDDRAVPVLGRSGKYGPKA
jgi:N6-L-threonylcarbamoyladenine synthase